jgi:hypothetical protein
MSADVSEEYVAVLFRIACYPFHEFVFWFALNPEDAGDMFLYR